MNKPNGLDVLLVGDVDSVHTRRFAAALSAAGLSVGVAGFEPNGYPADIRTWSLGRRGASDVRFALAIPRLARLLRQTRPQIMNAHYVSSYGLLAVLALFLLAGSRGLPALVQTAWGTDLLVTARRPGPRRWMAMLALRRATLITGDSLDLQAEAAGLAPGVPFHRFLFGPPAALATADREFSQLIVSIRRLDPDTRVTDIVKGFLAARAVDPELLHGWRLAICGDGSDRDHVALLGEGHDSIAMLGQLPADKLHRTLLRAHAFISIPVSDGTSAALLEGMAAGAIPIVNDLPANREWVDDEVGVVLSRDPTEHEIGEAIRAVIRRSPAREAIQRRVRGSSMEAETERLIDRFRQLPGPIRH